MKYSLSKRTIAFLLSVVMIFAMLPAAKTTAVTVQENSQIVDGNTMNSWQSFFSPTDITTAHAGGVWTDKSVFATSPFNSNAIKIDKTNNFLVALSALSANSVVVGQDYAPTDTMFVLDVSNSMSDSALSSMVTATNNAIRTLLSGENNTNRVGVVLYGTTGSVLLPLDHYTGVTVDGMETFIEIDGNDIRAARVRQRVESGNTGSTVPDWWNPDWGNWEDFEDYFPQYGQGNQNQYETVYLKNSAGNNVTTSVETGGGTYTQGGMWKAWQEFNSAGTVATDKPSVKRAPVMVLMCDGAATYSAADFDNVPNSATHGTGSASGTGDGFVTQLTAAYVKAKMAEKYGADSFFYTLGLDVENIAIAQAILDPANKTAATDIDDEWTEFLQGSATVSMYRRSQGGNNQNVTITDDTAATLQSAFTSESYKYADKYFSAAQVTDLNQQFQNIVNEISLSAGYYPTHLDDNGANYSGYITFVDELGKGMEVKEVEGIVLGDHVYTGELLAASLVNGAFGTKDNPTNMGDEFVRAVKARLGLTNNDEVWALLDYAWNEGYLGYTSREDWSNYIVWYGDANGEYLGYDKSLEQTAAYRNACYGMLGTADESHKVSDMMYVGIQVSTNLATGDQTVTFRVPASMLPVVTYQINVDGNQVTENTTATLTYHAAEPIRLVYEVGVKDEVTDLNVAQYATEIDGKYYLYTNKWNENPDLTDTGTNNLSYAYFEPGADNEHYYFTEDSVIYDAAGNKVTSTDNLAEDGDYYYEHYIFEKNTGAAITDGKVAASADFHKEKLSADAIRAANTTKTYDAAGNRCVPKGTMHYAHSHDLFKGAADSSAAAATANNTGTFPYVREQIVDAHLSSQDGGTGTGAKHYELTYLGNNGRLTVNPATGISITKQVDDTITDANATYTFMIMVSKANHDLLEGTYTQKNGENEADIVFTNGLAEVTLKAGETVYIYNLPADAIYSISEQYGDGYKEFAAVKDTGTTVSGTIQEAIFTNTKRGTGSLTIEKDVTNHPFTTSEIESVDFDFVVELTKKNGEKYSGDVNAIRSTETSSEPVILQFQNGKAAFTLHDNQELTIPNLPEEATYTVTETNKAGYTLVSSNGDSGTITANTLAVAHFVNKYVATAISPEIDVAITKTVSGSGAAAEEFTFSIEQVTPAKKWSQTITTGTGTANATKRLENLSFDAVGTYSFLVHEITPTTNKTAGMTYDAKRASFTVVVTDTDMDGQLEWALGDVVNATKNGNAVAVAFTNIYELGSVTATFHAKKILENNTGIDIPLTEFRFGLYSDAACQNLAFVETPGVGYDPMNPRSTFTAGPGGLVDIKVHINRQTINNQASANLVYYLKEIPGSRVGMTYDTTVYKVTIPVTNGTDLALGSIQVEPVAGTSTADGTTAVFNNKYEVAPTEPATGTVISGNKTLNGRPWGENESFEVELYETDASFTLTDNQQPKQTQSVSENTPYAFNLGQFTSVDIHHYIVKEKLAGKTDKGITYDATEYHVTVTVSLKEGTNQLEAVVTVIKLGNGTVEKNALNFKNTYHADATDDIQLGGTKVFENQTPGVANGTTIELTGGEFQFQLEVKDAAGNVIATGSATNDDNGQFLFDKFHFTKAGVYTATITEVNGGIGYITYAQPRTVTITVTDNNEGKLTASAAGGYSVQMKNTYKAAETELSLTGIKELVGAEGTDRPLQANDFSFTLKPVGTAPMPNSETSVTVKNSADGKFIFPDITFNAVGTYRYTITEEKETDGTAGIYYDKAVYTVTVDVTDNGAGKLVAKVTAIVANEDLADETAKHVIDFYNGYYADSVQVILSGNKVLENVTPGVAAAEKNIPLTGENLTKFPFSFMLEAVTEGAPMPNGAVDGKYPVNSGESGVIIFPALTFDAVGEYRYIVQEGIPANSINGVLDGVTYTAQIHDITITVSDNRLGQLVASVALDGNDKTFEADGKTVKALSFRNTYSAAEEVVTLGGNKVLENVTPGIAAGTTINLTGNEFIFKLEAVTNGAPMPAGTGNVVKNAAGGAFRFGQITFNAQGEYKYTITEISDPAKGYITYAQPVSVTIKVTDADMDGKLETAVTYGSANSLSVTNRYKAEATKLAFTGTKKVDTRNPRAGEFEFMLISVNGAPMPELVDTVYVKNDASGKVLFPEITYKAVGEYKYTIQEVRAPDGYKGVTYDKAVYDITVTVSDNGEGKLLAVAKSVKRGETADSDVVFFNKYQAAPISVSFGGTKTLAGRQLQDGEFSFILTDGAGVALETVKNKDGKFTFAEQKLLSAGTYKFFIKEDTSAVKEGIAYDKTVHEVTVEVKDDGNGQLKAYIGGEEKQTVSVSFQNTFTPKETTAQITVEKELQNLCGKPMGLEGFRFQLTDTEGNKTVMTSDADGLAKFVLTFGAEDAGKTYVYKLAEVDTEVKGVQYSDAEYEVKIAVTKDAVTGELHTTVTVTNDGKAYEGNPVFVNYYDLDTTPETGDASRVLEMSLCMGISGAALLTVLVLGKKKRFSAE